MQAKSLEYILEMNVGLQLRISLLPPELVRCGGFFLINWDFMKI